MKKKKIITIITILVLVVAVYFVYKGVNLYLYNSITTENYEEILNDLKIENKNTITKVTLSNEDYLTFDNIKIKNDFKNFTKLEEPATTENFVKYALYDENNETIAAFFMGKESFTYEEAFKNDIYIYAEDHEQLTKINRPDILKRNNINDDIDLINYIIKNKNNKNTIFTSVKQMQENYVTKFFSTIVFPKGSITLIEGDYNGFIFNTDNIKECHIIDNGQKYIFTFIKIDYFSDEKIYELLNTIEID